MVLNVENLRRSAGRNRRSLCSAVKDHTLGKLIHRVDGQLCPNNYKNFLSVLRWIKDKLENFVFKKEAEFLLTLLARAIDIQSQNVIAGLKRELLSRYSQLIEIK